MHSFLFGGIKYPNQNFNAIAATTSASMMTISVASIMIPAAFAVLQQETGDPILILSRGTSVIFQLPFFKLTLFMLDRHFRNIHFVSLLPTTDPFAFIC